jgi:hypothetical protein
MNQRLLERKFLDTGRDHNIDLYHKGKTMVKGRKDKSPEAYWYDRQSSECTFKPLIGKTVPMDGEKEYGGKVFNQT